MKNIGRESINMSQDRSTTFREFLFNDRFYLGLLASAVVIFFTVVCLFKVSDWGSKGEWFGAIVGVAVSFLSFYIVAYTTWSQNNHFKIIEKLELIEHFNQLALKLLTEVSTPDFEEKWNDLEYNLKSKMQIIQIYKKKRFNNISDMPILYELKNLDCNKELIAIASQYRYLKNLSNNHFSEESEHFGFVKSQLALFGELLEKLSAAIFYVYSPSKDPSDNYCQMPSVKFLPIVYFYYENLDPSHDIADLIRNINIKPDNGAVVVKRIVIMDIPVDLDFNWPGSIGYDLEYIIEPSHDLWQKINEKSKQMLQSSEQENNGNFDLSIEISYFLEDKPESIWTNVMDFTMEHKDNKYYLSTIEH